MYMRPRKDLFLPTSLNSVFRLSLTHTHTQYILVCILGSVHQTQKAHYHILATEYETFETGIEQAGLGGEWARTTDMHMSYLS